MHRQQCPCWCSGVPWAKYLDRAEWTVSDLNFVTGELCYTLLVVTFLSEIFMFFFLDNNGWYFNNGESDYKRIYKKRKIQYGPRLLQE
jgi:hypothetical protein